MRLRFFGGLSLVGSAGEAVAVPGRGQQSLLFRLAVDAGTTVGYRALAEDVWPDDPPDDPRAALQSLASRLRRAVGAALIESVPGGYRLALERTEVDTTHFQDLVATARSASDPGTPAVLARDALALRTGDPWTPGPEYDWVVRDLLEDRAHAERIARQTPSALPAVTPAIPAPLTPLVGRRSELATMGAQLSAERLVTLIGPGGAGKTTLALETARAWGDATVVVELAPASGGEVWAAVAAAAGRSIRVGDTTAAPSATSPRQRALEALAGRPVLIVLDNCEHVSAEAAEVALELLQATPAARILATSREPLGIAGEAFVDLGPLPADDAVELFSRRVRAARGAAPEPDESETVERIVRRLDGLPLALELAAARARTLTLAEIDEGLDDRFALLATGPRTSDARHQTLRALIDWSWETLTEPERTALLAASVFPDGIAAGDAATVARWFGTDAAAFDLLIDRSLLRRGDGGFRMLETVREYGVDRLRSELREAAFRSRQAGATAERALTQDALLRGPRVRAGLAWFDANEENVSAALRACIEQPELAPTGVELVRACLWAWIVRENFDQLRTGVEAFSASDAPLDSEAAVVVNGLATLLWTTQAAFGFVGGADSERLTHLTAEVRRQHVRVRDAAAQHPSELAAALPPLLAAADEALASFDGSLNWSRAFVVPDAAPDAPAWTTALIAMMRAALAQNGGDVETLGVESERALRMFRALGDAWGIAFASQMRSEWLLLQDRLDEALAVADASTEGLAGLTSVADLLQQRSQSMGILVRLGRLDEARERLAETDALAQTDGSDRALAQARMDAVALEIAVGDGEAALRLLDGVAEGFAATFPDQLLAWSTSKRAQALALAGRPEEAAAAVSAALPIARRSGDQPILADVVLSLAGYLAGTDQDAAARRALTLSDTIRGGVDEADPFHRWVADRVAAEPADAEPPDLDELAALLPPQPE